MDRDKDDRKKPQLRLVVNNAEKRSPRPGEPEAPVITLDELLAQRETLRGPFYSDLGRGPSKAYEVVERFLASKGWEYGLDPHHGKPVVIPAEYVCQLAAEMGSRQDEALLFVETDGADTGLCLSLEMILPFGSDDDTEMENALLYGTPILQYGTLFLDENPHDNMLDLVYRLAVPIYPPALTIRLLNRLFAIAAQELKDTILALTTD
jgi:hypothetical protein